MSRIFFVATVIFLAGSSSSFAYEFSEEIPYRVTGTRVLKLYEGPETSSKVVGSLKRGEGGIYIKWCLQKTDWCALSRGGQALLGWGKARYLSGVAD